MNIEQAAILIIQVLTTDMHSGETVVVAKGILDFAEAQVFTKVKEALRCAPKPSTWTRKLLCGSSSTHNGKVHMR